MKSLTDVQKEIEQDLKMLETTQAIVTAGHAADFDTTAVEYLKSILENQKVLALYLANHQLALRRAGMVEIVRTNAIAGESVGRGVRRP